MITAAQDNVCDAIEAVEGGPKFKEHVWSRPAGGGRISRVFQDGNVWEKARVNVSVVYGVMPPEAYIAAKAAASEQNPGPIPFFAAGISSMFLELRDNGGSVVGLILHLLPSPKKASCTSTRFKSKAETNSTLPSILVSRNGVVTTFTSSTVTRGEGM